MGRMLARLLASWLLVVQIVPTLCCLLLQEAPVRLVRWSVADAAPLEPSCSAEVESACDECAATDDGEGDAAPPQVCCEPCTTLCATDEPAPLERKDQRRQHGRPLAPEVVFAESSYPSIATKAPRARVVCAPETARWTSAARLRPFLQVWLI